jgi:cellulose synthase operon protein C
VAYRPQWKLPNLFLPVDRRLHPIVRRETIRQLLAADPDRLVWLEPGDGKLFTPQSVAEVAFRPLSDWVEYVIESAAEPLAAWMESTRFDFDAYVCVDPKDAKPKPPAEKPKNPGDAAFDEPRIETDYSLTTPAAPVPFTLNLPPTAARTPNKLKEYREELESRFLKIDGPMDAPERRELWPVLAGANAAIGDGARDEAAICYLNAEWTADDPKLLQQWFQNETGHERPDAAGLDALLSLMEPTPAQLRAFAATVLAGEREAWLKERLPAVRSFAEKHDRHLPVRAGWLLATTFAKLSGGDVLGLARSRDRLLAKLLEDGLSAERDLPAFLRYAGSGDAERSRAVREQAGTLHSAARQWVNASLKPLGTGYNASDIVNTPAYIDLLFAFAHAKFGDATLAENAIATAGKVLIVPQPRYPVEKESVVPYATHLIGQVVHAGYAYRIRQALAGKPHAGPLPPEVGEQHDGFRKQAEASPKNVTTPWSMAHYSLKQMRSDSRVLDPQEKVDPFSEVGITDDLGRMLRDLPRHRMPQENERRTREIFKEFERAKNTKWTRIGLLRHTLPFVYRSGEAFAAEMIALIGPALKAAPPASSDNPADIVQNQGLVVESGLFLAAHFDRGDLVRSLAESFFEFLKGSPDAVQFELIAAVAGRSLRSFRKLGLRDEIDKLLRRLQSEVLRGRDFSALKTQFAAKPDVWADALRTLTALAGGRLAFGQTDGAEAVLDAVRGELKAGGGKIAPLKYVRLACAYASAVGLGPPEFGLPRLLELFAILPPERITNTLSTAPYFSRHHLAIVEEVVLALVSDDFAAGGGARRWLDDDEAAVRRRVHADVRRAVG